MSTFSRLLGLAQKALDSAAARQEGGSAHRPAHQPSSQPAHRTAPVPPTRESVPDAADRQAIARYDYLLRTAEPQQIEQVHREAFARLTPAQRAVVEERMRAELPPHEQPHSSGADDLARAATRTEVARPGFLRGLLARAGQGGSSGRGGPGQGGLGRGAGLAGAGLAGGALAGAGLAAGGVLATVAGGAALSAVGGPLLEQAAGLGVDFDALASGVDLEGLTGGLGDLAGGLSAEAGEFAGTAGDAVSGLGEQVSGAGGQLSDLASGFSLPGLDDLFGR